MDRSDVIRRLTPREQRRTEDRRRGSRSDSEVRRDGVAVVSVVVVLGHTTDRIEVAGARTRTHAWALMGRHGAAGGTALVE